MADPADVRAVLREHGIDVPVRGKLSNKHWEEYERITGRNAADGADNGDEDAWDGPDDDGDVITAAPPPDPGDAAPQDPRGVPGPEQKPRRVRNRAKRPPAGSGLGTRLGFGKDSGKKKPGPKRPRVPVDRFITRTWEMAARLVAPISGPTSRAFALEGTVAGLIFEDMVRGTVADRVLQPVARAEANTEKVIALSPPLIVLAIERAQGLEEPRRQMQLAFLVPLLQEALTVQVRIAGPLMAAAAERMEADADTRAEVERLMGQIFPQATVVDEEEQAEPAFGMAGM